MFPKVSIRDYENNKKLSTFREFFVPTLSEIGFLSFISLLFILLFNSEVIWMLINSSSIEYLPTPSDVIDDIVNNNDEIFLSNALGQATGFVIWGIIGSIAYTITWVVQHFYIRVRQDVEEREYEHTQKGASYWESRFAQFILLVTTAITFVGVLVATAYLVPVMAAFGRAVLVDPLEIMSYVYLLVGIGIGVVVLYLLIRSFHVLHYAFGSYFGSLDD